MTLEEAKEYLGKRYVLHPQYTGNPAVKYRNGSYWLLPKNKKKAIERVKK